MSLKQIDGPNDLMTATDAGRILGVSVDMVRLLAKDGRQPFMSTVGGIRLFRRKDVDALARRRKRERLKTARAR
jgi:excisionase family DNA binding protein